MQIVKSVLAGCVLSTWLWGAENPFIGTWKLKPEKSTFMAGEEMKEFTVSFAADGNKIHRVANGTYVNGKPIDEGGPEGSTFSWDGKEHILHDASPRVAVACMPVKKGATDVTIKMDGNIVARLHASVSADGATLTEQGHNTNAQGKQGTTVLVFDKQ